MIYNTTTTFSDRNKNYFSMIKDGVDPRYATAEYMPLKIETELITLYKEHITKEELKTLFDAEYKIISDKYKKCMDDDYKIDKELNKLIKLFQAVLKMQDHYDDNERSYNVEF
jgi:hypothetical protein